MELADEGFAPEGETEVLDLDAIGSDTEPMPRPRPSRGELLGFVRRHRAPLAIALVLAATLGVDARLWSSRRPLTYMQLGWSVQTPSVAVSPHPGEVVYTTTLLGTYGLSLDWITILDPGLPLAGMTIEGQAIAAKPNVRTRVGKDFSTAAPMKVSLKIDPKRCASLTPQIHLRLEGQGADRHRHTTELTLDRFAGLDADPITDPLSFPDVCEQPPGSIFGLPLDSQHRSVTIVSNFLNLPNGKKVDLDQLGFGSPQIQPLPDGYLMFQYIEGAYPERRVNLLRLDDQGRVVWRRAGTIVGDRSADLQRILFSPDDETISIVDLGTGQDVARAHVPFPPNDLQWAGTHVLVSLRERVVEVPLHQANLVLYSWSGSSGDSLRAPGDLIPDRQNALGLMGFTQCSALQAQTLVFAEGNTGGGLDPLYLGTDVPGQKGKYIGDSNGVGSCTLASHIGAYGIGQLDNAFIEYSKSAPPRRLFTVPAGNVFSSFARTSNTEWYAVFTYFGSTFDDGTNSAFVPPGEVAVEVRCVVGKGCVRYPTVRQENGASFSIVG